MPPIVLLEYSLPKRACVITCYLPAIRADLALRGAIHGSGPRANTSSSQHLVPNFVVSQQNLLPFSPNSFRDPCRCPSLGQVRIHCTGRTLVWVRLNAQRVCLSSHAAAREASKTFRTLNVEPSREPSVHAAAGFPEGILCSNWTEPRRFVFSYAAYELPVSTR